MIRHLAFPALLALAAAVGVRAQSIQVDASIPYAFHGWDTAGYSVDAGSCFADHHFLGLEWIHFNPTPINVLPVVGALRVSEKVEALQLAYRFTYPIYRPLEFYLGAAAGIGRVQEALPNSPSVSSAVGPVLSAGNTEWCGELAAGLQFDIGPHFAIKGGYRYLDSFNNIKQFGAATNTDTKTLEIGVVAKF